MEHQQAHFRITGKVSHAGQLADMVATELLAQTCKSDGLGTVRYPVLEVTATVEPFENRRGFSLREFWARSACQYGD